MVFVPPWEVGGHDNHSDLDRGTQKSLDLIMVQQTPAPLLSP
jgi:hypothetical protein